MSGAAWDAASPDKRAEHVRDFVAPPDGFTHRLARLPVADLRYLADAFEKAARPDPVRLP